MLFRSTLALTGGNSPAITRLIAADTAERHVDRLFAHCPIVRIVREDFLVD